MTRRMSQRTGITARVREATRGELLEREAELAVLEETIARTRRGAGSLVVIEGPPGVGKSRLLAEAVAVSLRAGLRVHWARGTPMERHFRHGVTLQLFERAVAAAAPEERARLLAGPAGLAAPLLSTDAERGLAGDDELGAAHGLFWLATNLATPNGLLVVVDDAHWVDDASLRFLRYLLARLDAVPVAVAMALCPEEAGDRADIFDVMAATPARRLVRPRPLGPGAVRALVRSRVSAEADETFCRDCEKLTLGNPFLLHALLADVQQARIPVAAEGAERLRDLTPEAVRRALLGRLARLPAGCTALARAVAVLGDDARLRHAAAIADLTVGEATRAADTLCRVQILRGEDPLGFVHPLVAAVVRRDLSRVDRDRMHGRAARLLAEERAATGRVAGHLMAASASGDPWVVETLVQAATVALSDGAPADAAAYLARAVDEPPSPQALPDVLVMLGETQSTLGAPEAPGTLSLAIPLLAEPGCRASACRLLGTALQVRGRHDDSAAALERGLAEVPDGPMARELRAALVAVSVLTARPVRPPVPPEPAPGGPAAAGATPGELAVMALEGALAARPGAEVLALAQRAWDGGGLLDDEGPDGPTWPIVAAALTFAGECEIAVSVCTAVMERAAHRGAVMAVATASYHRSGPQLLQGRLAGAVGDARAALSAQQSGWEAYPGAATAVAALGHAERGELDVAEHLVRLADDDRYAESLEGALLVEARGRLRWLQGRPAEALDDYLAAGRLLEEVLAIGTPVVMHWRCGAALAYLQAGDGRRARALVEEDQHRADAAGALGPMGRTRRLAGQIEQHPCRAIQKLEEAAEMLGGSPARLEEAASLVALGTALRHEARTGAARSALRRGLDLANRLGAMPLARAARQELAATGARVRRTALTGPESLTPSELRVAEMAAAGQSNRGIAQALFVTPKGVEWHLGNAYRKLGVRSRKDLVSALSAPALPQPASWASRASTSETGAWQA